MERQMAPSEPRIAVMLPCLNEELTLAQVIRDFRRELPGADIYVFDNNSTDRSAEIAREEGAWVVPVLRRGKGYVVRKMFEVVEADVYIMVDADDTYDARGVHRLIQPVLRGEADMVVGGRLESHSPSAFRKFHRFGNYLIQWLINRIFGSRLTDICSGYRVMSRYFVKNIPFLRDGFEVETELTVYSLINGFAISEIPLRYRQRPPNSHSKLNTIRDGYKVLLTIIWLARDLRPLFFFSLCALLMFMVGTLPMFLSSSVLGIAHILLAMAPIALGMTGLILNTINIKFAELQVLSRRNTSPAWNHRELSALTRSKSPPLSA